VAKRTIKAQASKLTLPLEYPLVITRGTTVVSETVIVRVQGDDYEGVGECAPIPRYDETVDSVLAFYEQHFAKDVDATNMDAMLADVPSGARCGLDLALYDLLGKRLGVPLWDVFGLDPRAIPLTSFTIYINDIGATLELVRAHRDAPVLKIKLGTGIEIETIEAIRSIYTGTIRVDANEGWTPSSAVQILRELERFEIEFCEQPIPAGAPEQLRWVSDRTRIPIVVDEDSIVARDLPPLAGCVEGINIKLAKCGGIREALAMIHTARALGLKIMLGCMTESTVLITGAAHLAPMVDWVDLDGNLFLARDPFVGVTHESGKLTLPDRPGLGILGSAGYAT
jgi:L-alanine-DL-glutamate epimerase-like enolase superfamily enzyme